MITLSIQEVLFFAIVLIYFAFSLTRAFMKSYRFDKYDFYAYFDEIAPNALIREEMCKSFDKYCEERNEEDDWYA